MLVDKNVFRILQLRNTLCPLNNQYVEFPKASKCNLILKDPSRLNEAQRIFACTEIQITCQGERHLGAVIGSEEHKNEYVSSKVLKWVPDLKDLAKIAKDDPQAVLSAFTKSICHRWTFVQRTIPRTSDLFLPLEQCIIKDTLIPSILGRQISDLERQVVSLPVRFRGLGIANPVETAEREFATAKPRSL